MRNPEWRIANAQCPGAARKGQLSRILLEKLPFLVLSAAFVRGDGHGAAEGRGTGLARRGVGGNAGVAARQHPHRLRLGPGQDRLAVAPRGDLPLVRMWPLWEVLLATALLVAMTGAALWLGGASGTWR